MPNHAMPVDQLSEIRENLEKRRLLTEEFSDQGGLKETWRREAEERQR